MSPVANDADGRYGTGRRGMASTSGAPEQSAGRVPGGEDSSAGIGAPAISGGVPIVAAGRLMAVLTGAGVGFAADGPLGSLSGTDVSWAGACTDTAGVRRGGSPVTVRADEAQAARIEAGLDGRDPVDPAARRVEYRGEDRARFDRGASAHTAERVTTERVHRGRAV